MCMWLGKGKNGRYVRWRKYDEFVQRLKAAGDKGITCWKRYNRNSTTLHSWHNSLTKGGIVSGPGKVVSNRPKRSVTEDERFWSHVDKGIHVYRKRPYFYDGTIFPVRVRYKDLVAVNDEAWNARPEAVFMEVEITKRNWNRIMGDE